MARLPVQIRVGCKTMQSSSPASVGESFFLVPVAGPIAPAPAGVACAPLLVGPLSVFVLLAAIFVPVPVFALVPAVLVSTAQVPLAAYFPFRFSP
jgi:hypothetical protein